MDGKLCRLSLSSALPLYALEISSFAKTSVVCEGLFEDLLHLGEVLGSVKETLKKERLRQEKLAEKHPDNKHISTLDWDRFLGLEDTLGGSAAAAFNVSKETRDIHKEIYAAITAVKDE